MLRMARSTFTLSIAGVLSACAVPHAQIAPAPVPPVAFDGASCRELALMHAKAMRTLTFSSIAQDHNFEADHTRVFGVPLPMATLFERDREAEVARLKGDSLALAAQLERQGCVAREG